LLENKADVDAGDKYGRTALHLAAMKRHEAVVQLLLEHNVDVDAKIRMDERQPTGQLRAGTRR
jgi:ankyrin repeat protein